MKLFLDTEFTGLHQNTTLISIGLIAENGNKFYAEFNDYDVNQVDGWIQRNVLNNLRFEPPKQDEDEYGIFSNEMTEMRESRDIIKEQLSHWLTQFETVEIWSDCLAYDWVLFCELFGGALDENLPDNVYYIPFDLCTLFKLKDIDPDINREYYAGMMYSECAEDEKDSKHNSLWDAMVIKECYEKAIL